jgi:glucose/arabinose dehydrogenase
MSQPGTIGDAQKPSPARSRRRIIVIAAVALLVLVCVGGAYSQRLLLRSLLSGDINVIGGNAGQARLDLPPGFSASVYASGLHTPRFMAFGPDGTLFVADEGSGTVRALPDPRHTGKATGNVVVADNLDNPSSLAFDGNTLYIGETTKIRRLTLGPDLRATSNRVIVGDLPADGNHFTRTVLLGPDKKLYVAIGSSCNVCEESDPHRASVWVYQLDGSGSGGRRHARGLRNAVGLAVNPWNGQIWATNNGRDLMGDDTPPETVYALRDGADYGWPRCHAGDIVDPDFGKPGDCDGIVKPLVEMQAHSAPLGLAFYDAAQFPSAYRGLYVAFHGSWNRSTPTGYKVVFIPLDGRGNVAGPARDFATGWLASGNRAIGRPVGVTAGPDGALYVSDDKAGLIYRITYSGG